MVDEFVTEYNTVRLHSAIGYVTPQDMLEGRQAAIHAECGKKLDPKQAYTPLKTVMTRVADAARA